jgi:ubiquinone/menaquinone biosynthesis C-methylase UbiE
MEEIDRKKMIQKYYSERAHDYDRQKARTWKSKRGFGDGIIREIAYAVGNSKRETMLEVGVGSGRISSSMIEKAKVWLVGLDMSKEMLQLAKTKISHHKQKTDLILGDAEHLPFTSETFDAILCISTMHYFGSPEKSIAEFSRISKDKGILVYGDLTPHELDVHGFLDNLESTLSKAHAQHHRPSEMKKLLKHRGFKPSRERVFHYTKSYSALIEDKGKYFGIRLEALHEIVRKANEDERKLYDASDRELTLFYTLITAIKQS